MPKREQTPQEKELGKKPAEKEADVESFEEGRPNIFAEVPPGPEPEAYPHEPGFSAPDPRMLVRDPHAPGPQIQRDLDDKNQERTPDKGFGDEEHQLGNEIRERRKAG